MAVVDFNRRAIFIHIYKTGGTSYRSLLYGKEYGDHHCPAWQAKKKLVEQGQGGVWNEYFKFTSVRNPYDFIISLYHHLRDQEDHIYHEYAEDTIDKFITLLDEKLFQQVVFDGFYFFDTQWSWVSENGSSIIDRAFRFEDMETNFKELSELARTDNRQVHLNRSETRKDNREFDQILSSKSIATINRLYHIDFVNFGYEKIKP